jgi:hypothetical protein
MSRPYMYGCGNDECRACYESPNFAVVDVDEPDEVIERWVDGDSAKEAVADGDYGEPDYFIVRYLPAEVPA